jgi:hypothetical protein
MHHLTHIAMSRKELFDLVWSMPMSKLVKGYGITDVGLVKICKKHSIPRPPIGYWLRSKRRRGRRPALPNVAANLEHVRVPAKRPDLDEPGDPEAAALIAAADALPAIKLRRDLRGAHPLAREIGSDLRSVDPRLSVDVTVPLLGRARLIFDALLRALAKLGIEPEVLRDHNRSGYVFRVLGEAYRIKLRERFRHATPEELAQLNEGKTWPTRQEVLRSGRLELIVDPASWGPKRTWRDTERRKLQQVLDRVPRTLVRLAAAARVAHRARELERLQAEERERQRREEHERAERERDRMTRLLKEAADWQAARGVREYVEAVRSQVQVADAEGAERAPAWLDWATRVAEEIDPLPCRLRRLLES